jgi:hypothetical protein
MTDRPPADRSTEPTVGDEGAAVPRPDTYDPAVEAFGEQHDDVLTGERDIARVQDDPAAADAPIDTGA